MVPYSRAPMRHDPEQFLVSLSNLPRRDYLERATDRKKSPRRVERLLSLLGNPERRLPHVIHVTGTSGKGSVCTFLQAVLTRAGYRTGLMISPHPSVMRERWSVDGQIMTKSECAAAVSIVSKALDRYLAAYPADPPSLFDIQTAIGFWYFAKRKVQWAVIEVFLGGRFDATNVLPKKDIAVITSIGLDHTELLGNTKTAIAKEKSGIITDNCMVFTLESDPAVLPIIQRACQKKSAPLHRIEQMELRIANHGIRGIDFYYRNRPYHLAVIGEHQMRNAALVIDMAHALGLKEPAIQAGLADAVQPLRLEIISRKPTIILDGAHNQDKIGTTVAAVKNLQAEKSGDVHLMVGFSANKDSRAMVRQLATLSPASIFCTRNTMNPFRKVANPGELAGLFKKYLPAAATAVCVDPIDALAQAKKKMKSHDILLVTGSIFLSGELRKTLTEKK